MQDAQYVSVGGPTARADFHFRWELFRYYAHAHPNHRYNKPDLSSLLDLLVVGDLPRTTNALRNKVLHGIAHEVSGLAFPTAIPLWLQPHVRAAIRGLCWPNQTAVTTRNLLKVIDRVLQRSRRHADQALDM